MLIEKLITKSLGSIISRAHFRNIPKRPFQSKERELKLEKISDKFVPIGNADKRFDKKIFVINYQ